MSPKGNEYSNPSVSKPWQLFVGWDLTAPAFEAYSSPSAHGMATPWIENPTCPKDFCKKIWESTIHHPNSRYSLDWLTLNSAIPSFPCLHDCQWSWATSQQVVILWYSFLPGGWATHLKKICSSICIISPRFGVKIEKCLSCHHRSSVTHSRTAKSLYSVNPSGSGCTSMKDRI